WRTAKKHFRFPSWIRIQEKLPAEMMPGFSNPRAKSLATKSAHANGRLLSPSLKSEEEENERKDARKSNHQRHGVHVSEGASSRMAPDAGSVQKQARTADRGEVVRRSAETYRCVAEKDA